MHEVQEKMSLLSQVLKRIERCLKEMDMSGCWQSAAPRP